MTDIFLEFAPAGHNSLASYRLADKILNVNQPIVGLAPFAMSRPGPISWPSPLAPQLTFPTTVYAAMGWVGNADRFIICQTGPKGYKLTVEQSLTFIITEGGRYIAQVANEQHENQAVLTQVGLGPAFILALAWQAVFCLHASAAMIGDRVLAFVGESGRGKSTLAAYLATQPDWQLVADDILPITDGLALPHFPQLKLPLVQQPAVALPQHLPLTAVYVLAECPAGTLPTIQPLSKPEAGRYLLRHTVAAQLFGRPLLAQHFQFCLNLAGQLPCYVLTYPRQMNVLPQLELLLGHPS